MEGKELEQSYFKIQKRTKPTKMTNDISIEIKY